MIVGCYSLHLYCENGTSQAHGFKINFPGDYTGKNSQECFRKARAEGWRIHVLLNKAWCPLCVEAGNL